jgi:hypothetical protein
MTLQDEARQLRSEIARLRPDRRRRYSEPLRRRILDWVERAEASGMARARCVRLIGMNNVWRISDWQREQSATSSGLALVRVDTSTNAPPPNGVAVVTPAGYRIEGLSLEQLTSLLRGLA